MSPGVTIGGNKAGNGNAVLAILLELLAKGEGDLGGAEGRGGDHGVLVAVAGDCDFGVGGLGKLALDVAETCRNALEMTKPRNLGQGENTPISERKLSKFSDLERRYLPTTMSCMMAVVLYKFGWSKYEQRGTVEENNRPLLFPFYPRYRRVFIAHPRFFP